MQSLTITGLVVLILGFVFSKMGIPLAEGSLETTITTLVQIAGGVIVWWGRYRQGDISVFGGKLKE